MSPNAACDYGVVSYSSALHCFGLFKNICTEQVTRGGRGKSAVPARCFWPLTGPLLPVIGIYFWHRHSRGKASLSPPKNPVINIRKYIVTALQAGKPFCTYVVAAKSFVNRCEIAQGAFYLVTGIFRRILVVQ